MLLTNIDLNNKDELSRTKKLYLEAFPPDERAPFSVLIKRAKKGKADMFSLVHQDIWCGMAYIVRYKDLAYLFYFAVSPELRGQGLGSMAIRAILEKYKGERVFLALEDWTSESDNKDQRLKRHQFYLSCGLNDLPYHIKEANVIYAIMGNNGKVEPEEYKALINNYLGFFMRHIVDMRIIK